MTEKPLVTVIINCYNSEKYLRETIDSLIAQTYDNWEAIFWDNCSTDKTAEIITSFNEPRFRYFLAEKNTPLGEARNLAMKKINGSFFCFLDSDDVWLPNFLSDGLKCFKKFEVVGFFSNYYYWEDGKKTIFNTSLNNGYKTFKELVRYYGIGMSACILKTDVVVHNHIKFDNNYQLIEDMDFFLKVAVFGDFFYRDESLCLYRIHRNSTSFTYRNQWSREYDNIYCYLINTYVEVPKPLLEIEDLRRIKDCKTSWDVTNFISENNRREILNILLNKRTLFKIKLRCFVFLLLGGKLYNTMKSFID